MLADKPITALINETNKILASPLTDNVVPEAMLAKLQKDVFVFSGCKTHLELKEVSNLLTDANGKIKSFQKFSQEVQAIHKTYNVQYLEAEHIFATSSAESAARWSEYEADGDRYNLQYRTASDDRVRDEHAVLHNTTLPVDDPFWNSYFPPNGWRCRCVAVQVRKGKFDVSNSAEALAKGEKATTQIGKDGQNRLEMFRFNPGKQQVIFPPNHPYYKVPEDVTEAIDKAYEKVKDNVLDNIKTIDELKEWAKTNLGITKDFSSLDLEPRKEVYLRLKELKEQYPNNRLARIGDTHRPRVHAEATGILMNFNPKYFNNKSFFNDVLNKSIKTGHSPIGCSTPKSVIDHEFAHVLTKDLLSNVREGKTDFSWEISDVKTRYNKHITMQLRKGIDVKKSDIFISEYAKKDVHEFCAESFSMVLNNPNPSPYAKEVYDLIIKEINK